MSPELGKLQQLPSCSSSSVDKPSHGKKSVLQDVPASPVEPLRVALPAVAENTDSRGFTLKSVLHYRLPLGSSLRKSWETYLKRSDHEFICMCLIYLPLSDPGLDQYCVSISGTGNVCATLSSSGMPTDSENVGQTLEHLILIEHRSMVFVFLWLRLTSCLASPGRGQDPAGSPVGWKHQTNKSRRLSGLQSRDVMWEAVTEFLFHPAPVRVRNSRWDLRECRNNRSAVNGGCNSHYGELCHPPLNVYPTYLRIFREANSKFLNDHRQFGQLEPCGLTALQYYIPVSRAHNYHAHNWIDVAFTAVIMNLGLALTSKQSHDEWYDLFVFSELISVLEEA
ncbi:hypothetical protein RRG08_050698 [Elysia crispata]|uniref:Uncharacterized protein n=1 Tax=Elysia crispata TaxID=231223 RepID=A0AAE1DT62_9GAST|nr:hypothetical protein RRG08_050698 [Elysia crispata]